MYFKIKATAVDSKGREREVELRVFDDGYSCSHHEDGTKTFDGEAACGAILFRFTAPKDGFDD